MSIKDNLFQEVNEHEVLHVEIEGDDERVVEMCRLYWQCDKNLKFFPMVSHIAAHMGTNVAKLTQVVKAHSFAFLTDDPCPACGGMQTYKTRIEVTERSATWACEDCTTDAKERALAAKRLLQQHQREQINNEYAIKDNPLDFEQETLENCVLLLSLIRAAALEDEDFFLSVVQLPQSLCPSHKYSVEAVTKLCRAGLICVHPSSPLDAFEFDAHGNFTGSYDESKVFWTLPVGGDQERAWERIDQLESTFSNMEWPDSWYKETTLLWKKIASEELLEYLLYRMNESCLYFKRGSTPGRKTHFVLSEIVEEWSTAQGFRLCYIAAKQAADYYEKKKTERIKTAHAANSVFGFLQRQSEQARVAQKQILPYNRIWHLPQSTVSQVFYNAVLQIGDRGFTERPGSIEFVLHDAVKDENHVASPEVQVGE